MGNEFFLSVDRQVTAIVILASIVLIVNQLVRLAITASLHRTIRAAVSANSPLAPQLIDKLDQRPTPESDSRTGVILLAVAGAMILVGLIQGEFDWLQSLVGVAVFPALIGIVLLWRSRLLTRSAGS